MSPWVSLTAALGALAAGDSRHRDAAPVDPVAPFDDPDRLPDHIRLIRIAPEGARFAGANSSAEALAAVGFEDAGTWAIEGMSELGLRLLAHPPQAMLAAVYVHARVDHWIELVTLYADGEQVSFTNLAGGDLAPRPGHTVIRMHDANPHDLYARAFSERPMGVLRPVSSVSAPSHVENAYARWRAWRRSTSPCMPTSEDRAAA